MKKFRVVINIFILVLIMNFPAQTVEQVNNKRLDNDRDMLKDISPIFNTEIRLLKDPGKYLTFEHDKKKDRNLGLNYRLAHLKTNNNGYATVRLILLVNNKDEIAMFKISIDTDNEAAWNILSGEFNYSSQKNAVVSRFGLNCITMVEKGYSKFESDFAAYLGKPNTVRIPAKIQEEYELLRNPLNDLVYGAICSAGAVKPHGRVAIEKIMKYGNVKVIENILRSANPEGRIYAIQALFAKNVKSLKSKNRYSDTIDRILKLGIPVNTCFGCTFDYEEINAEKLYNYVSSSLSF